MKEGKHMLFFFIKGDTMQVRHREENLTTVAVIVQADKRIKASASKQLLQEDSSEKYMGMNVVFMKK